MIKKYGEVLNFDIIMEGTMKKSPPQKPKAFFTFITKFSCIDNSDRSSSLLGKRWRNRHFVLYKTFLSTQVYLLYFKVEPSPECKNIGSIDLVKLTNVCVDVGSAVKRSNVFSMQTLDENGANRIYYLCAQSFDMMNIWVEKIVTSLNLNNYNNSRYSNVLTLPSPASQNLPRGIGRVAPYCLSTPRLNSAAMWSTNTSPEVSRFQFQNLMDRPNENIASSYYNLSPGKNTLFQENLEDPINGEDEDIYKIPCETPNQHAYVNLNGERNTPFVTKSSTSDNIFFSNDDSRFQCKRDSNTMDIPDIQEFKEYQNLSNFQCQTKFPDENEIEIDDHSFDFPLPTRLRGQSRSSSSSSSSNNSSSDEEISNNQCLVVEKKSLEIDSTDDQSPPRVPKRLNLQEPVKTNATTETVLPIKTPKLIHQKADLLDLYTNLNDESLSSLNYVDAENLLLENRNNQRLDLFRDSPYSSLVMNPPGQLVMYPPILSSSELNCTDINFARDTTPSKSNFDDLPLSSLFSATHVVKDVLPSVEYREICDARTEALLKLSVRILNNE